MTTNGETGGNALDGHEDEEPASRLAQDAPAPILSGDSMLGKTVVFELTLNEANHVNISVGCADFI